MPANVIIQNSFVRDYDILVGGRITTYNGVEASGSILLNSDGTRNTTFDYGTGFNAEVNSLARDSNGKIYVGGRFTTYKGVTETRIIRLNPDGSKDTGFDSGTGFINGAPETLAIDSNGKIYAGGGFTIYKGVSAGGIIRLNPDGSKDTGFDNSTGFDTTVNALTIDSNGKIYVAGQFSTYKGVTANGIIRLNPDGSKDTGFDNTTGFNAFINTITIDSNGKIYVGGAFTSYKGVTENCIIRLNPDGSKDTGFDNSTGFNSSVRGLVIDSNGKIYAVGNFDTYKGVTANRIIRLNPDGSKDTGFDNSTGFNGSPWKIGIDINGKIYLIGFFSTYKGQNVPKIVRVNPDGSIDTQFTPGTGFGSSDFPFDIVIIPDPITSSPMIISPTGTNTIIVT